MANLSETPTANRVHIAFFGLRNAGKSTLVNAFTRQALAIVDATPGTTTDPVSKAMEILPLGPCLVTDTAGLDDVGGLGRQRVEKTLKVLETTDLAVWVSAPGDESLKADFLERCRAREIPVIEFSRGDAVEDLRRRVAAARVRDETPGLLDGLVRAGDRIVCVCPIDAAAPKGRLILPQVQALRACLDLHAVCIVCQPAELAPLLASERVDLILTDSQAFRAVRETVAATGKSFRLTSFSILFARQKGDLDAYREGLRHLVELKDGDRVLVAEGCTHHRQCDDIGTTKIPKAVTKLSGGRKLDFVFASGADFDPAGAALVVQCGGCMLTRREVRRRIRRAQEAGIPIVNYGMVLALAAGVEIESCVM